MGKKFFCCDAVLDTKSRQIAIYSGYAKEMQPISWETRISAPMSTGRKSTTSWYSACRQFPLRQRHGHQPHPDDAGALRAGHPPQAGPDDHCVFIVSSICDGYFHDERWPYLRELYEMFQHDYMNTLPDMNRYGEYFATNEEYIRKYRFCQCVPPVPRLFIVFLGTNPGDNPQRHLHRRRA